jgi:hypothetical protein
MVSAHRRSPCKDVDEGELTPLRSVAYIDRIVVFGFLAAVNGVEALDKAISSDFNGGHPSTEEEEHAVSFGKVSRGVKLPQLSRHEPLFATYSCYSMTLAGIIQIASTAGE